VSPAELAERLGERFEDALVARGEVTVTVGRDEITEVLTLLRDDPQLRLTLLSDLSCTDWPGRDPRIWMAYHLSSPDLGHRVRVKTGLPPDDLRIASVAGLHLTADWQEREVFDLYGVTFEGHPDLRRIILPEEWEGHPMRKDEPLGGVPTQYKGAFVPPPDERGL
jgi:NADH-quinone oxidoreductase subunit C